MWSQTFTGDMFAGVSASGKVDVSSSGWLAADGINRGLGLLIWDPGDRFG